MPIYEFECEGFCGKVTESIEKVGTEVIICPKCKGMAFRIMSKSEFHLKGDAWAKDNYTRKKPSYVDRPFKPLVD